MANGIERTRWKSWSSLLALPLALACHGRNHSNMNAAELSERMQDVAEYALDHVDADDRQIGEVNRVIEGLSPDLVRFRQEHRELGAKLRAELAKDQVDRAELEIIRQAGLDLMDRASARATNALADAAAALSAEQRRKLTAKWEKHQH